MAVLGRAAVELWLGQLAAAEASAQQALGVLRAIGDATWTSAALAILDVPAELVGPCFRDAAPACLVARLARRARRAGRQPRRRAKLVRAGCRSCG
jgi:hypothetical protein